MPPLHLTEAAGGRCRLWMGGCAHGDGATLQEAADDLVHRVLGVAALLGAGVTQRTSTDLPLPDPRLVALMHEIRRMAARGEDVRERLLGFSPA
jgi:hypothetical protein